MDWLTIAQSIGGALAGGVATGFGAMRVIKLQVKYNEERIDSVESRVNKELESLSVQMEQRLTQVIKDSEQKTNALMNSITELINNREALSSVASEKTIEYFTRALDNAVEMNKEIKKGFERVHDRIDSVNADMREFQNDMQRDFVSKDTCNAVLSRHVQTGAGK